MTFFRRPSRSTWWLMFGILVLVLMVLGIFLATIVSEGLAAQRPTAPTRATKTIPNTDVNPFGANFFLEREVEPWKLDKTLQMAEEAGIGWVKQQFPWEEIEPRRKGEFLEPTTKTESWTKYDRIVEVCEKHGMEIIARLDRPPDWTRQDNTYKERPPDDFEDYGDFVYEFVKRYKGRINYIQIWNEPNIFPEWGNQAVDPAQYVELLKIAYRRAKEANPNVFVLDAPLAITLGEPHPDTGKWRSMNDLQFLEEMYKAGVGDYFDIHSANAFGMDRPPEDPPDPEVLNFQRVLLHRQIMEEYGDKNKAVWFNEYGWNAAPESFPPEQLTWQRVSEEQQAEYTLRGIELAQEEWPWAGVFMLWYFRQVGNISPDRAHYYFRLVDPDFTPRLVYLAVQEQAKSDRVMSLGLYQETNLAIKTAGRWGNVIDDSALGQAFIRSDVPGDSLTFSFQGSQVDLVTRRWQGAGRLLVLLDDHAVPGIETNDQGISLVDLYSAGLRNQARVPLVRDASPGMHTLQLTVDAERNPAATGHDCAVDGIQVSQDEDSAFPIVPFAACILGLGLDGWLLWRVWRRLRFSVRVP